MAYTLSNAVTALRKRHPWTSLVVEREPLTGLVDGSNKVFHLANPPAQTLSVTVYDSSGVAVTPASVSVTSGLVTFTSAPTEPYTASYTHVTFPDSQMEGLCEDGFALMQSILNRPYYLYTSSISSSSSSVVDPVIGSTTFSALPVQIRFFLDCCDFVFLESMQREAAFNAINVREERMGGLQIDRSKQPAAFPAMLDRAWDKLMKSAAAAADEAGLSSTLFEGDVLPGAKSDYNYDILNWHRYSKQDLGIIE